MKPRKQKDLIGWREWVALPALGVARLRAKVDTGARTSALGTVRMNEFEEDGVRKVRFELSTGKGEQGPMNPCIAVVIDSRWVTNSGGSRENRVVIRTPVVIGTLRKNIEITLTNRNAMKHRMLLGRTAVMKEFYINPGRSYLAGEPCAMNIMVDDLSGKKTTQFIEQHIQNMRNASPPESLHVLGVNELKESQITVWSGYDNNRLVGCIAMKEINAQHGEIKSMRTHTDYRGQGVGSMLLTHILGVAKTRGYRKVSLETGSMAFFDTARKLYLRHGFCMCEPFVGYKKDPQSVFMTITL